MNRTRLWQVATLGITMSVLADTGTVDESLRAIDEIRNLYAEFQTFKNDEEFRRVGYGRCCKYHRWMKEVDALRGHDLGTFLRSFGIVPEELFALGILPKYGGRTLPASTRPLPCSKRSAPPAK